MYTMNGDHLALYFDTIFGLENNHSYVAVFGILLKLRQRATLRLQWRALLPSLKEYLSAGALVLVRTVGKVMSYTVCGREAALLGAVPAAAHNLMFNLGE